MSDINEIGDISSCVAYFVFRDSKSSLYDFFTIKESEKIFQEEYKRDKYIYYCQCSNKDELKNKLDSWCKNIGLLTTGDSSLSNNEIPENDNTSACGDLLDDTVANLVKTRPPSPQTVITKDPIPEKYKDNNQEHTIVKDIHKSSFKNDKTKPVNRNSFLCIYAHMDKVGLGNGDSNNEIGGTLTWEELFVIIKDYVSTLWLAGCKSDSFAKKYFTQFKGGKLQTLLVTTSKECWLNLLKHFKNEYSLDNFSFDDEVLNKIYSKDPTLAISCNLYCKNENGVFYKNELIKYKQ